MKFIYRLLTNNQHTLRPEEEQLCVSAFQLGFLLATVLATAAVMLVSLV